jgi:hypothetical protein
MDAREAAIAEEQHRLRQVRILVDFAAQVLAQEHPTRSEGEALVAATRRRVLELFPEGGPTFDLILAPRFARLLDEHTRPRAKVLPFRPAGRADDDLLR